MGYFPINQSEMGKQEKSFFSPTCAELQIKKIEGLRIMCQV
jgi:hypothetical protein